MSEDMGYRLKRSLKPKARPSERQPTRSKYALGAPDAETQLEGIERTRKRTSQASATGDEDLISSMKEYLSAIEEDNKAILSELASKDEEEKPTRPVSRGDALSTETGKMLMQDLKEAYQLTDEQAAGFVGNLAHETGDFKFMQEIEPVVAGSKGGYGFAQWTGPRRKAFEEWALKNKMDVNSYEANLGFLMYEIDNTSEGAFMEDLKKAKTVEEATKIVSEGYLRPGKPNMSSRQARAYGYMEQ